MTTFIFTWKAKISPEIDDDLLIKLSHSQIIHYGDDVIDAASNRNERLVETTFQKSSLVDGDW